MMIRPARNSGDAEAAERLARLLWPHDSPEELATEMNRLIGNTDSEVFLAFWDEEPCGFAHCSLRRDYVEGTHSSPVGYLEGIYVREECRGQGIARLLLRACEDWAAGQGCSEFASDCEQGNTESAAFHVHCGFREANRIVCFAKNIGGAE